MLRPNPLSGALLLLIMSCSTSFRASDSTETGNPPVIDSTKVGLLITSDEVHVQGEPGAVQPPRGEVEATIISSGEVATGPVQVDGSFDVEVNASAEEAFEVRALLGDERSAPVYVVRGGAAIGAGEEGGLSCDQRNDVATGLLDQAASNADRSCGSDGDCLVYTPRSACSNSCWVHYLSMAGVDLLESTRAVVESALCPGFEAEMCSLPTYDCAILEAPPSCVSGLCRARDVDNCQQCLDGSIRWGGANTGPGPHASIGTPYFTIDDCNRFSLDGPCFRLIERCGSPNQDVSISQLNEALEHPDVVAAFEAGGDHGIPQLQAGRGLRIWRGEQEIGLYVCDEDAASCAVPPAFQALYDLLTRAQGEHACGPDYLGCSAPYQIGTAGEEVEGYWYDPDVQTCLPRTFTGKAVNANRYDTLTNCGGACGGLPISSDVCSARGRVLVENVCTICLDDGTDRCSITGDLCLKPCRNDDECIGESFGELCNTDGFCTPPACGDAL